MNENLQEELEDALNDKSIIEAVRIIKRARDQCATIRVALEDTIVPQIHSRLYNRELPQPRRKTQPIAGIPEKKPEFGKIKLARYVAPPEVQPTNPHLPPANTVQYLHTTSVNNVPVVVPENCNSYIYKTLKEFGYSDEICYYIAEKCSTIEEATLLLDNFK